MREQEFRDRVHAALGEAPDERAVSERAAAALHAAPPGADRAGSPRAMAIVAGALVVLVVAVLLGSRLFHPTVPAPVPAAAGASLTGCRLPMVVADSHSAVNVAAGNTATNFPASQPTYTAGFVSVATGRFVPDHSMQLADLPFSRIYVREQGYPQSYDAVLKRWLPAPLSQVSPDRQSYLYTVRNPLATGKGSEFDSSTLHVYDVATGQDRALWTYPGDIGQDAFWLADGIHAWTTPPSGGALSAWLVDPATGAVTAQAGVLPPAVLPQSAQASYHLFGGFGVGTDGAGRPIVFDGTSHEYFVGGPNGRRIVIHTQYVDDYDPNGFTVDGDRLWSANVDGTAIWAWTERGGLKRYALSGVARFDRFIAPRVVGPCV